MVIGNRNIRLYTTSKMSQDQKQLWLQLITEQKIVGLAMNIHLNDNNVNNNDIIHSNMSHIEARGEIQVSFAHLLSFRQNDVKL